MANSCPPKAIRTLYNVGRVPDAARVESAAVRSVRPVGHRSLQLVGRSVPVVCVANSFLPKATRTLHNVGRVPDAARVESAAVRSVRPVGHQSLQLVGRSVPVVCAANSCPPKATRTLQDVGRVSDAARAESAALRMLASIKDFFA